MERLLGLLTLLMTVQLLVVGAVLLVLVVDERLVLVGLVVSVVWVLVVRGPVPVVRGPVPVGGSVPVGRRAVPGPRGAGAGPDEFEVWVRAQLGDGQGLGELASRLRPVWEQRGWGGVVGRAQRCRHEAAHAVVAHEMGCVVTSMDVRCVGGRGGRVEYVEPLPSGGSGQEAWVCLVVAVAGMVMDLVDGHRNGGSGSDVLVAEQRAAQVISSGWVPDGLAGPVSVGVLVEHARAVAMGVLCRRAVAVDALARAVNESGVLTGARVRSIIEAAIEAARPAAGRTAS